MELIEFMLNLTKWIQVIIYDVLPWVFGLTISLLGAAWVADWLQKRGR